MAMFTVLRETTVARWPLRHAALPNYRQISQKRSISAGEMYLTIRVEWTDDQFGLDLTYKSIHF